MIVMRFQDTRLAQASYPIGCGRSGTALVIAPMRGIEQLRAHGGGVALHITQVTETHIHADFVSRARARGAECSTLELVISSQLVGHHCHRTPCRWSHGRPDDQPMRSACPD